MLLEHGANSILMDSRGRTPLHISLERNIAIIDSTKNSYLPIEIYYNEQVIRLFLNYATNTGLSVLCVTSAMHSSHYVENLVTQGFNAHQSINMQFQTWPGYTALHFAAHVNLDIVKLLIKYGADIEAKDVNGVTPFDMCIERYKARDIYDLLCSVPKCKEILLSDGKTKLVGLIFALQSVDSVINFLQKSDVTVKLFVPLDSPLWPGFTVLHLAVLMSERKKCKSDFQKEEEQMVFKPDLTVFAKCLKQDADVTAKDQRGWTPIHFAFRLGKEKCVELMLQYHYRMNNSIDNENLSHLHVACAVGNRDLVQKLLWNDVDVNIAYAGDSCISCVYPGWTPLHIAVYKKNCEIAKLLLKFGADVHAIDRYGFTPIHTLEPQYQEINRILFSVIEREVVVKSLGLSYLHVACSSHNVDAVEQLLNLGVDVNKIITCNLDATENYLNAFSTEFYDGWTPMHFVLDNLHVDSLVSSATKIVTLLLDRGADMLIEDSTGASPLTTILETNSNELLEVVLKTLTSNEDLQNRVERETGLTMLHIACRKKDYRLIKELLDNGADVNVSIPKESKIWLGYTPLHVLILSFDDFDEGDLGCEDVFHRILKLLLERDADLAALNAKRRTPLHMAYHEFCYKSKYDSSLVQVVMMLRAIKNFEVNPASDEGVSHFHIACHLLEVDVVEDFLNHGEVDVNSAIDLFSSLNIAACTPLLLAARERRSYHFVHPESFDRLRIVDLLIKHGARVDAEDVDGNTAAHHAVSLKIFDERDENLLERLAKAGAEVNARNVRGETPMGLLVKHPSLEEIQYFIDCGCRFNAFNLVTEEGYIALATTNIHPEKVKRLLFRVFLNSPDLMKKDNMNRTAIHNIVSINESKISKTKYAELFDLMMKLGCDVDDKDDLGRTALHLAAQFRNHEAVNGLLLVGADMNVTDKDGKTPFAYVFEACSRCNNSDENHNQYDHDDLIEAFALQVRKLQLCNLELHKSNERFLSRTFAMFTPDDFSGVLNNFLPELEKLGALSIKPYSITVADFARDPLAVINYPLMSQGKRKTIDHFFQTNKMLFQKEFKQTVGVVQLQYRHAVLRKKIIDKTKNSLASLMGLQLPDVCSHIVLKMLKNSDFQNLILSTSVEDSQNMDVDS